MTEFTVSTEMSPAMVEKRFATPAVVGVDVGVAEGVSISAHLQLNRSRYSICQSSREIQRVSLLRTI